MMRLLEVFDFGVKELGICSSSPAIESFIFLEETTGKSKEDILINNNRIDEKEFLKFRGYLKRRLNGEPWQYIVGKTNFLGFDIFTESEIFIPRPETELMAVQAISKLKKFDYPHVLEVGCGTGAISISIAARVKKTKIITTDISKKAVRLCKKNVEYHKLNDKINIVCVDLFKCFVSRSKFDMIISNPPYILKKNLKKIDTIVKKEPFLALDGGDNGVVIINKILENSSNMLKKGGLIFIEIDSSNLPYIDIPNDLKCSYEKDQYNKIRFLYGVKL